jgi:hypothetical protein
MKMVVQRQKETELLSCQLQTGPHKSANIMHFQLLTFTRNINELNENFSDEH